jgi:hypothetical protein
MATRTRDHEARPGDGPSGWSCSIFTWHPGLPGWCLLAANRM